jgi:hypothetical protein
MLWSKIATQPMYPATISIGGASIELFADGTWKGDADKFEAALKAATKSDAFSISIAWLVMNAIRRNAFR